VSVVIDRRVPAAGFDKAACGENGGVTDERFESGEADTDESGRNPTQRRIDERGEHGRTDEPWEETPDDDQDEPEA
jgi:hypothetical protein